MSESKNCWLYVDGQPVTSYKNQYVKMQSKELSDKEEAITNCLYSMIVEENYPDDLMIQAIKFVNPVEDTEIKKLLLLFWEIIEKKDRQKTSELKSEFLLVCNGLRKDLTHPNEYIRGRTLRLIAKLPYYDLYESVRSVIFENLQHKHAYVRKNALFCISETINHFGLDSLPTDICQTLKNLIFNDSDISVKRNAYLTLAKIDTNESLISTREILQKSEISEIGDLFVLAIVKNIKQIGKNSVPSDKAKIVKILIELLQHKSNTVLFEIAYSLLDISSNSSIVKLAVSVLSNLLADINENNTLIIIFSKLNVLKLKYRSILEENVITFTTILTKSDLTPNIRIIILDLIRDLLNENNINQVFHLLKQQFLNNKNINENSNEFKFNLLETMFNGIKKFPGISREYVLFFIEKSTSVINLKDKNFSEEQCGFLKDIFYQYKGDSFDLYEVALRILEDIINSDMISCVLNILAEYHMLDLNLLRKAFEKISKSIGDNDLILLDEEEVKKDNNSITKTITKTVILKDGSYGTETVTVNASEFNKKDKSFLREALLNSSYFFSCNVAVSLTKIYFYLVNNNQFNQEEEFNKYYFKCINILSSIIKLESPKVFKDDANLERISQCFELVLNNEFKEFLLISNESSQIYDQILKSNAKKEKEPLKEVKAEKIGQFISFRQVTPYDVENFGYIDEEVDEQNTKLEEELLALVDSDINNHKNASIKNFVEILTGSEDPLIIEAAIEIFTFDIVIEFNIKNKSKQDLQNITIELHAPTSLEIIEKAPVVVLKQNESTKVRSCIKFSQSCNCFIFGEVSFSNYRGTVSSLNLSGVFINLLDTYAAKCSELFFRKCWNSYNWEHKTIIVSKSKSFKELINNICDKLSLRLVLPEDISEIDENSAFLVANLYTKSKLGEDALVNISVEKIGTYKITGSAVIRSKVKEFATFQGERIKNFIK